MEVPQLTPGEFKTLQLFAHYCRSYGANSVYKTIYLQDCNEDWSEDRWYSREVRHSIDSYDKIDELISKLVNNDDIIEYFSDCEGTQRIEVEIYCKDRILTIEAFQTIYGTDPHGSIYNLEDIESEFGEETLKAVEELFEQLEGREARVDFSGGGDSGYIDDFMMVDNEQFDLPSTIEDMLNRMLNQYAGWENNEGGQGSWTFYPHNKEIDFDFNYNTEEEERVDLKYEIKF